MLYYIVVYFFLLLAKTMRNITKFNCSSCSIVVYTRNRKAPSVKFCTRCQNESLWQEYKSVEKRNVSAVFPDKTLQSKVLLKEIRRQRKHYKINKLVLSQFNAFYEGDGNYYPGTRLNYRFSPDAHLSSIHSLENHLKERISNIERNLKEEFGSLNNVQFKISNGKIRYLFKCPECKKETFDLKKHLKTKKHDWSDEEATCEHSYRVRIYN